MIVDGDTVNDGSFNEATWESITSYAAEHDMEYKYYKNPDSTKDEYLASIETATSEGAKIIVLTGSNFETTVYEAQSTYSDVDFLILDGVPNDGKTKYATTSNTVSIIFAEEESGYLAGYAAVMDGYTKLGFMGGKNLPSIKRYGYGFIQGAAQAAADKETKIEMRYTYTESLDESDDIKDKAAKWYEDGTEVIFTAGGSMNKSVMSAAEEAGGKVIGSDVDQSSLSSSVITSAKKDVGTAVTKVLKSYGDGNFVGGTAFNYAAKNNGVSLEIDNAGFNIFTEDDYNKIFKKLSGGKIEVLKDTQVKKVKDLAGSWITLSEE
jgi:basic membrane protein A